jgi:hypothetical protein
MNNILKYILVLAIAISSTYITKSILTFQKERSSFESFQISARTQEQKMLNPVVKLSYLMPTHIDEMGIPHGVSLSTATGFGIEYDAVRNISYALTNAHFCNAGFENESSKLVAETSDYFRYNHPAQDAMPGDALYMDRGLDLCIVAIYGYIAPATIADIGYEVQQFENIYIVGAPSGVLPIIIDTYMAAEAHRTSISLGAMNLSGNNYLLVSEQVFPGHSGSPIFNESGEVVGVIFASLSRYGGIGIPLRDIYIFLQDFHKLVSN